MPTRAERAEEVTERLLDAAEEIIAETGMHGLTIRSLAAQAGMTTQPIYSYFGDKASIVEAVFERAVSTLTKDLDELLDPLGAADADTALNTLHKVAADYRRFALENPGKFAVVFLESDEYEGLTSQTRMLRESLLAQMFKMQSRIWPEQESWVAMMVIAALNGFINAELSGFIGASDSPDLA